MCGEAWKYRRREDVTRFWQGQLASERGVHSGFWVQGEAWSWGVAGPCLGLAAGGELPWVGGSWANNTGTPGRSGKITGLVPSSLARASWVNGCTVCSGGKYQRGQLCLGVTVLKFFILFFLIMARCTHTHTHTHRHTHTRYAKLLQLCPILCAPMNYSSPGSSVHGILQARMLEWVAMPSSRESSWPRDQTHVSDVSCIGRQVLSH